jgi:hypothetical protein
MVIRGYLYVTGYLYDDQCVPPSLGMSVSALAALGYLFLYLLSRSLKNLCCLSGRGGPLLWLGHVELLRSRKNAWFGHVVVLRLRKIDVPPDDLHPEGLLRCHVQAALLITEALLGPLTHPC